MGGLSAPVAVHVWPDCVDLALAELRSARALTVIRIAAPETTIRSTARAQLRGALCDTLGSLLERPAASIPLISQPGLPLELDLPGTRIGLSLSHAEGLSVAALHVGGPVGVDVMRVLPEALPDWAAVAQDYLGPQACDQLAAVAPAQRAWAFAQAWTRWEAGLKCLGLALTEWTPGLAQRLALCRITPLALPAPYCGALATQRSA
jgi:4'-phosphopantetheinyl transferase